MIPSVFEARSHRLAVSETERRHWSDATSGAVIGFVAAFGALGGVGINLALRQSYLSTGTDTPAYWIFLAFYVFAAVVTWTRYVHRPVSTHSEQTAERSAESYATTVNGSAFPIFLTAFRKQRGLVSGPGQGVRRGSLFASQSGWQHDWSIASRTLRQPQLPAFKRRLTVGQDIFRAQAWHSRGIFCSATTDSAGALASRDIIEPNERASLMEQVQRRCCGSSTNCFKLDPDSNLRCGSASQIRGSAECSSTSWPAGYSRTRDKPDEWQLQPDRPEVGL